MSESSAIEIRDLTVEFSTGGKIVPALQKLDLKVVQGEVYGFIGPNGAGKTTTMHVLLGFIEATSGIAEILRQGRPSLNCPPPDRLHAGEPRKCTAS